MAKIKKVLIDALYINNSGGKVLLDYLINTIIEKDLSNKFYFLLDPRGKYDYLDKINYEIGKPSMLFRFQFYSKKKENFNKVFCFANLPPLVRLNNTEVYTYFHNTLIVDPPKKYSLKKKIYLLIQKSILIFFKNNTTFWIMQSNNVANLFRQSIKLDVKRIKIIPFFKLETLIQSSISKQKNTFIYASSGAEHKNHKNLLKAWGELNVQDYNPKLVLTIPDINVTLQDQINTLNNRGADIVNLGYLPFDTLKSIYLKTEFLIYPSLSESFGLPLIEAINFGCKILASDLPYVKAVVKPSLVFNPTDVNSITQVVKKCLISDVEISECLVENEIENLIMLLK